jgi:hypothetical protein
MGLLETIQSALTTAGVASADWPCFIGYTPDVGPAITLYYTGGFAQDTHQGETRRPTFQVAVRGDELGYAATEAKIRAAFAALENANLSGVYLMHAMSEPLQWNDAKNRTVFSQNYRAVVAT